VLDYEDRRAEVFRQLADQMAQGFDAARRSSYDYDVFIRHSGVPFEDGISTMADDFKVAACKEGIGAALK
jgi:hypothetical protein